MDIFSMVEEFHRCILDFRAPHEPGMLDEKRRDWFIRAAGEELGELYTAATVEDQVDAIVDLIYFAAGRLDEMGVDGRSAMREVHRANMTKKGGTLSKRPGSQGYDAVKPEGWKAPVHRLRSVYDKPKLLIIGHARHGKDTVCEILKELHGYRYQPASLYVAQHVIMPATEPGTYKSVAECYADRVNRREQWFTLIAEYCKNDHARIGRAMFENNDIYAGVRSKKEFAACRSLADMVIWVDASCRLDPEPPSSNELGASSADIIIQNNGSIEELEKRVRFAVNMLESAL